MISLPDLKNKKLKLSGERLYLRVLEPTDATEEYVSWLNDPEVNHFLATKSATMEEVRDFIFKKNLKPDAVFFGIFIKENDRQIGTIKLEYINLETGTADIAIIIGNKNYWGQGLSGEAMKILINYAFINLGLKDITLGVLAQNQAAVRSYQKLGFQETEVKYKFVRYGDQLYDQVTMILKREVFKI